TPVRGCSRYARHMPATPVEPDYFAATLAIIALVVSVAGFVYTVAFRARPLLRVEWSELENNDERDTAPLWNLTIANRGNGPAYDVRVHALPGDGSGEVESLGTMEPDTFHQLDLA